MIQTDMREYHVPLTKTYTDDYGQTHIEADWNNPAGVIKMALYPTTYETQSNSNWKLANFVGLTKSIKYGPILNASTGIYEYKKIGSGAKLRGGTPLNDWEDDEFEVVSILKMGRYYQVFLRETYG